LVLKTAIIILIGLGLGIITIALHMLLTKSKGLQLTSFLMILIASVYYGFALLSKNKTAILTEIIVASIFVMMGIFGLWISPWIIIIGLFLHGFWDIAHHNSSIGLVEIPKWYIPFCATYDWTIAIYITLINF
jgi:hypothetical protein